MPLNQGGFRGETGGHREAVRKAGRFAGSTMVESTGTGSSWTGGVHAMTDDEAFLAAADDMGSRLCAEAIRHDDRCVWLGDRQNGGTGTRRRFDTVSLDGPVLSPVARGVGDSERAAARRGMRIQSKRITWRTTSPRSRRSKPSLMSSRARKRLFRRSTGRSPAWYIEMNRGTSRLGTQEPM